MELTHRLYAADIEFQDVHYEVKLSKKTTKVLLDNVCGSFNHGLLNCIMGPSGAGKSSLLNALAGFQTGATGKVIVNGIEHSLLSCANLMSAITNYVFQDDHLFAELTVRETINYAAWFKLPAAVNTREERNRMADLLLNRLGLKEVAHRRVDRLSGGQRKRVSVALDLINCPPILFLDEPTTGLDSVSSYRMIDLLKDLTMAGCNIICTIHQPNSKIFHMFDTLFVLARGGRCAYQGPAEKLVEFMHFCRLPVCPAHTNPADFLFEGDHIERLAEAVKKMIDGSNVKDGFARAFMQSKEPLVVKKSYLKRNESKVPALPSGENANQKPKSRPSQHKKVSRIFEEAMLIKLCSYRARPMVQFAVLIQRSFIVYLRDMSSFLGRLIAAVFCTVLLGVAMQGCGNDATKVYINVAYLSLVNLMIIMPPVFTTVMNGPENFNVVVRENFNSWYHINTLYWAKTMAEVPCQLAICWVIPVGGWYLTQQPAEASDGLLFQVLIAAVISIISQTVGFILGMVADARSAYYLPFAVVLMCWLYSGYAIPIGLIPVALRWIHHIVYSYASFWTFMRLSYWNDPALECPFELHPLCHKFRSGYDVLREYHVPLTAIWPHVLYLLGYMAGVLLLGWLVLVLLVGRATRRSTTRS